MSVNQKRQRESQTGVSKKHKPNRKSLGVPPKKTRKTGKEGCGWICRQLTTLKMPQILSSAINSCIIFTSLLTLNHKFVVEMRIRSCLIAAFYFMSAASSHPANSSDSEDQSVVEGTAKATASKNSTSEVKTATLPKCRGRSPPSSHKYHKQGDADHHQHRDNHGRSQRVYKWSFQMCKCHTLT